MVSATITSSARKKHAEEGTGSLSCPINKTPLPPYLTLYTRKILLNLVLDEYPRREKGVKGKKEERKKCNDEWRAPLWAVNFEGNRSTMRAEKEI